MDSLKFHAEYLYSTTPFSQLATYLDEDVDKLHKRLLGHAVRLAPVEVLEGVDDDPQAVVAHDAVSDARRELRQPHQLLGGDLSVADAIGEQRVQRVHDPSADGQLAVRAEVVLGLGRMAEGLHTRLEVRHEVGVCAAPAACAVPGLKIPGLMTEGRLCVGSTNWAKGERCVDCGRTPTISET